jgi:GTP pyrophosphokinase
LITSSELIGLVKEYDPSANGDLVRKAYVFAMEAHGVQKRASGAPYFYHPAEVAKFLAELKLDVQTVVTGLLHDVIEDTNVNYKELEEIFGAEIAFLVEGVTKLSKINYTSSKAHQAENFRKFLLAMSKDIRVLIVKLVDRLNNMRTLSYVTSIEKRKRISLETLEVYAPLAERIGMSIIKDEMEDLAFYNLHPHEYSTISLRLDQIRNKDHNFVQNTILEMKKVFNDAEINAEISGREKKVYSIWRKMRQRNVSLEQINDIVAFRVIVDTVQQCYLSLGVIHINYQIMPGRFKDYISIPKLNGYRSLHTTVIGPLKQAIEVQIRTKEMHRVADEGVAAHWSYKNDELIAKKDEQKNYSWIKSLLTILQTSGSPEEIMDNSKLEIFENEVFCFTPNGDLITLPRGATSVDFAYEIHSDIGNTCIGAKVNGKIAPLKTVLRNGDQVEIITSLYQQPEASWERFVVTGKARACIKKFMKAHEKSEFTSLGLQLVKYIFNEIYGGFSEDLIELKKFSCSSLAEFYCDVGKGVIPLGIVRSAVSGSEKQVDVSNNYICLIDFTPGIAVHFSECCTPILGDKIVGIFVPQKGIEVHATSCECIEECKSVMIKVKWNHEDEADAAFIVRLRIVILNETESFAVITNVISENGASITNIKVEHRSTEFFDLLVDLKVKSVNHIGEIQAALRTCSNVRSVRRL